MARATRPCRFAPRAPPLSGVAPWQRPMTSITIAGPKFSGKPGDWPETKTEIVDAFNNAGFNFVTSMGELLFKYAGSGDHSDWKEEGLKNHFREKKWPIRLVSLRSEITKRTLDTKSEEYTALPDDEKKELRDFKVTESAQKSGTLRRSWRRDRCWELGRRPATHAGHHDL